MGEDRVGRKVRLGGATEFVKNPSQGGTQGRIEEVLLEMRKGVRAGRVKAVLLLALRDDGGVEFATVARAEEFARLVAEVPRVVERVQGELRVATELEREGGKVQ
jgi:hypothetical protein